VCVYVCVCVCVCVSGKSRIKKLLVTGIHSPQHTDAHRTQTQTRRQVHTGTDIGRYRDIHTDEHTENKKIQTKTQTIRRS
jgi:hypothetical protein